VAFWDTLEASLGDLRLTLPAHARTAIDVHVRLLLAWTEHVNLTAIRDPAGVAVDLVADSLAAVDLIRAAGADEILDLGSGGGFPGLPIAATLSPRRALLVESVAKKARFLEVAVAAMGLAATVGVAAERAERLGVRRDHRERWPIVTVRAVGSLAEIVEIGLPLTAIGGLLIAWKRRPIDDELDAAADAVESLGAGRPRIEPITLSSRPDDILLVVPKIRSTPGSYPRDPTVRRRRTGPARRRLR
jgi:16S rRNA (guanine527-N7)-methyltransferase